MNPKVKIGDRIICFHMEGELGVPPGTKGTVTKIGRDPFEPEGEEIISVEWDNGSRLSLLSTTDYWKLDKERIKEAVSPDAEYSYFKQNPEIFTNFDWKFLRDYLYLVRDAGPVNMFESAPFLISGKESLERYYGEGREDDEDFQKVLEMADQARDKMIQGTLKYMESKGKEIEIDEVNRLFQRMAVKIVQLYVAFSSSRSN
jgi:hypothetical protein